MISISCFDFQKEEKSLAGQLALFGFTVIVLLLVAV